MHHPDSGRTDRLLPSGKYRCRVKSATDGKTQKGVNRWSLVFEVVDGPHAGGTIRDCLYASEKALPRVKLFFKALGVEPRGEAEFGISVVRGRELLVELETEEYDGLQRNRVAWRGYSPLPPPPRPEILAPDPSGIPEELKSLPRWVNWRLEARRDSKGEWKWTKVPTRPRDGENASSTSPIDWDTFDAAWRRYQAANSVDGVGFVFTREDGFVGIDLDGVLEGDALQPWAREILERFPSYTERSVRGSGAHILGRGVLPPGRRKSGAIEVYSDSRFFVVTGRGLNGYPREIAAIPEKSLVWLLARMEEEACRRAGSTRRAEEGTLAENRGSSLSDDEIIERASSAANGEKFKALWHGNEIGYPSPSEGDLALCRLIAFWTGPHPARVDALFRRSARVREKWDQVHGQETYGASTIRKAIAGCSSFFRNPAAESPSRPSTGSSASRPPMPFKPFPVEVIPEPLRGFIAAGAGALGCDPVFLGLPVLSVAAGVIGNSCRIRIKQSWDEPAIMWVAIVAESGTLKSPAMDKALVPVNEIQREKDRKYREDLKEHRRAMLEYERGLKQWKTRGEGDPPEEPEPPVHERVLISDPTAEAAALILKENPRGLLLARDELAGWLGAFDSYKTGQADGPFWLQAHRGGYHVIDRKTGIRHIVIPRTTVSICGCFQPKALARSLGAEHYENGMAARFLFAGPPRRTKRWTDATISPEVMIAYRSCVARLAGLSMKEDADGEAEPHVLDFADEARETFVQFYDDFAQEQAAASGKVASALAKLEGYVGRFALIFELVDWARRDPDGDPPTQVGRDSVERAIRVVRWFAYEIPRVYQLLSEDEETTRRREQVEFLRARGGAATVREIQRSGTRLFGDAADEIEATLDGLAAAKLGEWEALPPGPEGGRPTRCFRLREDAMADETLDKFEQDEVSSGDTEVSPRGGREPGCDEFPGDTESEAPECAGLSDLQPDRTGKTPQEHGVVSGVGVDPEDGGETQARADCNPEEETTWTA